MAANVKTIQGARIVANGGEITSDRYKNDSSNDLTAGQIVYLAAGVLVPLRSGAGVLNTTAAPFDAANKYFMVLKSVDVSADIAGFVPVQEIDADTILEGYVVDSGSGGDVTMDTTDIGKKYPLYMTAAGLVAVDNVNNTTPLVVIEDVDSNYEPYRMGGDFEEDDGGVRHQRVRFSVLAALLA